MLLVLTIDGAWKFTVCTSQYTKYSEIKFINWHSRKSLPNCIPLITWSLRYFRWKWWNKLSPIDRLRHLWKIINFQWRSWTSDYILRINNFDFDVIIETIIILGIRTRPMVLNFFQRNHLNKNLKLGQFSENVFNVRHHAKYVLQTLKFFLKKTFERK